jgi:GT2 family glycosyltransferase
MMPRNSPPLVSLITVNYNGLKYLKNLYDSLYKLDYPMVELVMVDNASTDGSVDFMKIHYPEVLVIQNSHNYMFARGNNEGIKVARGEIIGLVNNDVEVAADFLNPIVKAFRELSELAACQPKVRDLTKPGLFEYAGAAGGFIDRYGYPFMRGRLFFTMEEDQGQYDKPLEIFWSTGACFFIRRSVINEIGLLDEDFVMHMEEIDLCWRMHLVGHKIFCIPASLVFHKGGGTLPADNPTKTYWNFRNNIFLLVKNAGIANLIRFLSFRLFLDFTALIWEVLRGKIRNSWSIIKAYLWILLHLPLLIRKRWNNQRKRKVTDQEIFRLVYPGSIVWEYFILDRKKFSELRKINRWLH